MTTLQTAAQQALWAFQCHVEQTWPTDRSTAAIAALRAALAQQDAPAQEPVAWSFEARHIDTAWGSAVSLKHPGREHKYMRNVKPLYLAPPQRQPLTIDEAMQQPRAMAQAYENGYKAGAAAERKRIIQFLTEMQRQVGDGHNYYGVAAMRIREMV